MLSERDKHIIEQLVDAHPNEVAFQVLCYFRERCTPQHYIYAGELIGMAKAPLFDSSKYTLNFSN